MDEETAEFVSDCVPMAVEAFEAPYPGHMFAVMARVHRDPHKRKHQHLHMLQMVNGHFGPREGEEFQDFFDAKLTLN